MPINNRCCLEHTQNGLLPPEDLEKVEASKRYFLTTPEYIASWIQRLTLKSLPSKHPRIDFREVSHEDFDLLTGITKENFDYLLHFLENDMHASKNRSLENALGIFLLKLRTGISHRMLQLLFVIDSRTVVCILKLN